MDVSQWITKILEAKRRGENMKRLIRTNKSDSMLFGVCGGLAKYFELDSTLVRLGVAILGIVSGGAVILGYFIAAFIIPSEF